MRVLLQRVSEASVAIGGEITGKCGRGFLLLVGITHGDTVKNAEYLADKCANLRVFEDENGKMNLSLKDVNGSVLAVSQFTLYADTRRGRRPAFVDAAPPAVSQPLYDHFVEALQNHGLHVETGRFGADMKVRLVNDGPVTILLENPEPPPGPTTTLA